MADMFLNAAKKKYRYPYNGMISTEDLFDLDPQQLDAVYKALMRQVRKADEDSLLEAANDLDRETAEKAEIIRKVFQLKKDAARQAERDAADRARSQRIMEIIRSKEDDLLAGKSIQELREMLTGPAD